MSTTRRNFCQLTLAVSAASGAAGILGLRSNAQAAVPLKPLRLLVLGGTGFIGPEIVSYALSRGHDVTLFNRGRTRSRLFPEVERLTGDRDGHLDALKGRAWDAVIDNTGYIPRIVRDSVNLLHGSVGRYLFMSTGSVYDPTQVALSEEARLQEAVHPESEDVGKYYGQLKVLCEQIVLERYGPAATVVRPHIVAGPGDKSGRYTYWPLRISQGGEIVAPGDPDNLVQYIDVRDLAEFCVHLAENSTPGIYNAAGPTYSEISMEGLLYAIRGVTSADVKFTWLAEEFLAGLSIRALGYPLWIPMNSELRGFTRMPIARGVGAGLRLRPLAVTAYDTLQWFNRLGIDDQNKLKLKLNLNRDSEILAAWHRR